MNEPRSSLAPALVFAVARARLSEAVRHRQAVLDAWHAGSEAEPLAPWVATAEDGAREVWCSFELSMPFDVQAEASARRFVLTLKEALDAAVLATAWFTCAAGTYSGKSSHAMPLCRSAEEFDALPREGHLMGLRPDQVRALRQLQPFAEGATGRWISHLTGAIEVADGGAQVLGFWAAEAEPEVLVPCGVRVVNVHVDEDGLIDGRRRIASVTLDPNDVGVGVRVNPRVFIDPVLAAAPWPTGPDDSFAARTRALTIITRHLIEGLERSVNTYTGVGIEMLAELDVDDPDQPWKPIAFEDTETEAEARTAISVSDRAMATYRAVGGALTYMRLDEMGRVIGREIPAAGAINSTGDYGTDVENAVRAAAGRWGLPDFVLRPSVVAKGSGIREIGDGTIVTGPRGITLQVKSRDHTITDEPARAASWLMKNARAGLRQARGTIRTLTNPAVTMENLRGRDVALDGRHVKWVPVVILDYRDPPAHIEPEGDTGPSLTLLRSDWEFLWNQLRSASAVVDYVHRVAGEEPLELGMETNRYFELADRDHNAAPAPVADWLHDSGAASPTLPLLPTDPPASTDELGFEVFQSLLHDIAASKFDGEEEFRVHMLGQLDRVAVAGRAGLGRLLLRNLAACARSEPGTRHMAHRLMFLDDGDVQLTFSTMDQFTGYEHEVWRTWLLHRRQKFLLESEASGPELPWTVGVLLTPRPDGGRPWDTSVVATDGPAHFDDDEYERLFTIFPPNDGVVSL